MASMGLTWGQRGASDLVNLQLSVPNDYDPDIELPLAFVQKCAANAPDAGDMRFRAMEICEALRQKHPDAAYIFQLSGMVALITHNRESALHFWARALTLDPAYTIAKEALEDVMAGDEDWADAQSYVEIAGGDVERMIDHYVAAALELFAAQDLAGADRLCQRASALKRVNVSQLSALAQCRMEAAREHELGTLAVRYDVVVEKYRRHWQTIDSTSFEQIHKGWRALPDRSQLADIVAELANEAHDRACAIFELGCLCGYNFVMARERLDERALINTRFYGLEPNADAVAFGNAHFPWIDLQQGSAEDMMAETVSLPEKIDLCVVSRVFMILHPDEVARIIEFLSHRVSRFLICDDIMNVDGDFAVVRQPGDFEIMHPFRKLLGGVGFSIERMEMARVPDRECSGFIVAGRHA